MDVTPGVRLRIGELVLDGVEPSDPRVAAAVRQAIAPALAPLPPIAAANTADAITDALPRGGER